MKNLKAEFTPKTTPSISLLKYFNEGPVANTIAFFPSLIFLYLEKVTLFKKRESTLFLTIRSIFFNK